MAQSWKEADNEFRSKYINRTALESWQSLLVKANDQGEIAAVSAIVTVLSKLWNRTVLEDADYAAREAKIFDLLVAENLQRSSQHNAL